MTTIDVESAFREAAATRGLVLPARLVADGTLHRCGTTEKPNQMDGAYILHLDGVPAGGFENHRDGLDWQNWCAKTENQMSDLERAEHRTRMISAKKIRDDELTEKRARAKREAEHTWGRSHPCTSHPYLTKKGVKAHGARTDGRNLVVSAHDISGEIHTLQMIDEEGDKRFLPGGRKQGCFYAIGNLSNVTSVFIVEGFATGASVHEATGIPTVVAFDCGNLKPVAEALRKRWPRARITICADDDGKTYESSGNRHVDNPGVTKAMDAAKVVDGKVAIPKFGSDRRNDQTDWNDVHKAFGIEGVKRGLDRFIGPNFSSSTARLVGESKERMEDSRNMLRFGVKFLDDALGGITRTDLVLVGAKTGAGKTQLATIIAKANCQMGKRVHYFALEAEDREIERRMKYQILANLYYAQPGGHRPIRYLDWSQGQLEEELSEFDDQADEELSRVCRNLSTYYKEESFTSEDFSNHFDAIQNETDLAILDLFSEVDSDDENENRAAKRIVVKIRNSVLRAKRPVVIVGHVKKSDPRFSGLVPDKEEFHGSSALIKAVTKSVMLAPDYDTDTGDPALWSTFMKIVKCRKESALERYCAKMIFDTRGDSYRQEYSLGRLVGGGKKWSELNREQIPHWSSNPRGLVVDTIPLGDE